MQTETITVRHWGATPQDWEWAAYYFGGDLLPAVAEPSPHVEKTGRLKGKEVLNKIPSEFRLKNGVLTIGGFQAWTDFNATYDHVEKWKKNPAYNILLQTRSIRAIDIDIPDPVFAAQLEVYITHALGVQPIVRSRPDSGKRTLLVRVDPLGIVNKKVIVTPKGKIEFLATGQQTALCGTHPDGARFELHHAENGPPTVTIDTISAVWDMLRAAYDPTAHPLIMIEEGANRERIRAQGKAVPDPVVKFLEDEGWVTGYETSGVINVRCPAEHEHGEDTGPNSSSWMPRGKLSDDCGKFKCLHSHGDDWPTHRFLEYIGYNTFEANQIFAPTSQPSPVVEAQTNIAIFAQAGMAHEAELEEYKLRAVLATEDGCDALRDNNGKMLAGQANINHICRAEPDLVRVKYDEFAQELEVQLGVSKVWKPVSDNVITKLRESIQRVHKLNVGQTDLSAGLHAAAEDYSYDSAADWVRLQVWDGVPRIKNFARDILKASPDAYADALGMYLWVALTARVLSPGVKADMAPILVSPKQGTGKSSLVRAIAPFDEWYGEIDLSTRDDDTARLLRGKAVIELPELKGLQSRDAEAIKAWMTKQIEEWTPKYKEFRVRYPRRCLFIGTDNRQRFLSDPTGNRRFLPLRVATTARYIDWPTMKANVGQYWAEAAHYISQFDSAATAVDTVSREVDALAAPARIAATILDERFDDAKAFLSIQAPDAVITITALRNQLGMTGQYDNYRAQGILLMLGWEQVDGTNKWTKPNKFVL